MKNVLFFLGFLWLSILGILSLFAGDAHAQNATLDRTELPATLAYRVTELCVRFDQDGTPQAAVEINGPSGAPLPVFRKTLTGARAVAARNLADTAVRQAIGATDGGAL